MTMVVPTSDNDKYFHHARQVHDRSQSPVTVIKQGILNTGSLMTGL